MYQLAKKIYKLGKNILLSPFILNDYRTYRTRDTKPRFACRWHDLFPQVFDKTLTTGFDRHYVYHTAWAARQVKAVAPTVHVDIASSLYFAGIVSSFIPVEFYDYRPAPLHLAGLTTKHADLTNLHFATDSIASLSCMHTIEHVGLGRYGDPIDPEGDVRACQELARVLAPGGSLIFVTPVGREAVIEFNAHRIYTYELVLKLFPTLMLKEFSLVPEFGTNGIIEHANPTTDLQSERYACGLFVFTK
jgi:SAM-dependent methyltransferase